MTCRTCPREGNYSLGYCRTCYQRAWRLGSPDYLKEWRKRQGEGSAYRLRASISSKARLNISDGQPRRGEVSGLASENQEVSA